VERERESWHRYSPTADFWKESSFSSSVESVCGDWSVPHLLARARMTCDERASPKVSRFSSLYKMRLNVLQFGTGSAEIVLGQRRAKQLNGKQTLLAFL
jgi:hypothetical protein